jgi:hypothetical protein
VHGDDGVLRGIRVSRHELNVGAGLLIGEPRNPAEVELLLGQAKKACVELLRLLDVVDRKVRGDAC